ncbi:MAG: hypothetical protein KBT27_07555, partial [Prevotellaceae bacterium]|nr:hypothetical protein [Candidatus Faecinaster equi]
MKKYRYIILFLLALFAININADCLYKIGNRKSSKDIKSGDKIIIEAAALIGNTGKYLKGQPDIALMAETSFIYSAGLTTECIWEVVDAKAKDTKYNDKELYYLRMVSDGYYLGFATDTGTKNVRCLTTKTSNAYTFVLLSPTEAGTKSGSSPAWDNNSVIFQCTSKNIQLGNSPTSTTNSMVWMYAPTADNAYTFQPWNVYEIQEGEDAETLRTNIADLIKQIETDDTDYYSLGQFNAVNDFTKAMNIARKAVENGGMTALEYKDCYDNLTKAYVGLQKPFADLLDVVFNLDGTATDISPMQQTITKKGTPKVTYNETFGCNMVSVDNTFGGSGQNYYRTNPYSNNKDFISRISDGHTLEAIFRTRVAISNKEAKWFSSHQGGGFGLMLCTAGNGKLGGNEITYLPNISASGSSTWRWATSGVVPEINTFYHVVGVWNKDEQKAYIYVNGKLRNSVSTPGDLVLPSSSCQWIGIGADPSGTNSAEASGAWDIVTSRIYDQPLTDYQVSLLYNKMPPADEELVTNIDYMGGLNITTGIRFPIDGEGFTDSDNIILTNSSKTFTVSITKTTTGCYFIIPSTMTSGDYKMTLQRGQRSQFLGVCSFKIGTTMPKGCQVIAHRGFWTKDSGTAQNSRQAIRQAMELNIYGAETDVWVTSDGHVMVNHDGSLNGVSIQNNPYSTVCQLKLSNGETIPELEDLFKVMDEYPNSPTKLIIEVKFNNATNIENNCKKIVEAVRAHNIQNRVEYISYSLEACRIIAAMEPDAWVASLGTNPDSPATLYKDHVLGLDYSTSHYNNNPSYIPDAEKLGMTTNVYTIDT